MTSNYPYAWRHAWGWIWWYLRRGRVLAALRQAWRALVLGQDGEACQFCGRGYISWAAPMVLWDQVFKDSGGLACPSCFDRLFTRKTGMRIRWIPGVIDRTKEESE